MYIPQDIILNNLKDIGVACDSGLVGTIFEQQYMQQAITYIRNLYGRTVEQHQEIQDYCHQLGIPTEVQALPEYPFNLVVGNLQTISAQCGIGGDLSTEWGDWARQAIKYIGNLRQIIEDWQRIIKDLSNRLQNGF